MGYHNNEWDRQMDLLFKGHTGHYWGSRTPEGVLEDYKQTLSRLREIREQLKTGTGKRGPLRPSSIKQIECEERRLLRDREVYKDLIRHMVEYNLLPVSKIISGEDRRQFVFSLRAMLELPEFGRVVYYANRLLEERYHDELPATNQDFFLKHAGDQVPPGYRLLRESELKDHSRESIFNCMVGALRDLAANIERNRDHFLTSGTPWKPKEVTPIPTSKPDAAKQEIKDLLQEIIDIREGRKEKEDPPEKKESPKPKLKSISGKGQERTEPRNVKVLVIENDRAAGFRQFDDYLSPAFKAFLQKEKGEHPAN